MDESSAIPATREPGSPLWRPYTQMKTVPDPLPVVGTSGSTITLADGRVLVDGIASWWTACHGYNHPHIAAAVADQLARFPHVMFGGLTHAPAETLARRLAAMLPGDLNHVFFSDSGSVAVEVAMKMAVQYWLNKGTQGRTRFVSFRDGYHGDTMATMSVCDPDEGMHRHFGDYLPAQFVMSLPDSAASRQALRDLLKRERDQIAAVIVEPLAQGAGGMKFHASEVLAALAALCREAGHLLILDEVMTGFGRTGTMFACEQAGVVPDIICLSKALTGGTMGLAATVATDAVFEAFWSEDSQAALMHGPTFMANPLACAAANASLDLFGTEPRLQQVASIAARLADGLAECRGLPGIVDVRVRGAIGVVQVRDLEDRAWLRRQFLDAGVWIRPFRDIVYLTPAFTIDPSELDHLTGTIRTVMQGWSQRNHREP